ncbi:hypothetical protein XAP412_1030001 [Xanthomonas phaseoli pv. phaseoli]|uniref:Uncharacterized protein n=1 Tax=Xanthomonas campestris pv. phaseoli TaxID=317013 RepID=A0AB38DU84_XANCH|nr:hypothetical protein XAP412_1030001 [Xanthomonas phaseoli pv. phaseoli]SON75821.1 hypothetical protein XAP6984_1080001 [Xanthomonas phaseoli pv. phaseoli]SON77269.1 hypothetical protein XAP7430_1050001 [Xanthomonas phaseoli pv. phaseoli]SOO30436.1 hypothetical protein XAP6164_4340001 [Xanthomonas phaseoli pv. phaseoli]
MCDAKTGLLPVFAFGHQLSRRLMRKYAPSMMAIQGNHSKDNEAMKGIFGVSSLEISMAARAPRVALDYRPDFTQVDPS